MTVGHGNKLAVGHDGRKAAATHKARKPYSDAVREMLDAPLGAPPAEWPADRKAWTHAQELAERDMTLAIRGDGTAIDRIVNRAEGRVPMAPEDREAVQGTNAALLGGLAAAIHLQMALGLVKPNAVDTTIVEPGEIGDGVIR